MVFDRGRQQFKLTSSRIRSINFFQIQIFLTLYFLAAVLVGQANGQGFALCAVTSNPKTVSKSAVLTFNTQLTSTVGYYNTGDTVQFDISGGYFIESTTLSLCQSQTAAITISQCTITTNRVVVKLTVTGTARNFLVNLQNYYNPHSTTPVTGVKTTLRNSAGTQRAYHQTATLQGIIPDVLSIASVTPQSQIVGAADVYLRVSITTTNLMLSSDRIEVYFPPWNPTAGELAFHQILSDVPDCQPVQNTSPLMTCGYNFDKYTLTVYGPILTEMPGGTELVFDVGNFYNPYSGIPRSGITINTTDSVGGKIDSTVIAQLTLTYQVTQFTAFQSISITRMDTQQIVGELSTGRIDFTLDLPIDPNCRIEIVYPRDMPLTDDMKLLTCEGNINNNLVSPTSFDTSTNTFYIDGCTQYDTAILNSITMYQMKNKGHVMATESFKIYLWAIDSEGQTFPIAKREENIIFRQDQFTQGTVNKFTITPIESTEVQNHTRYIVHFWPVHNLPQSSKINITFPYPVNLTLGPCLVQDPLAPLVVQGLCEVQNNTVMLKFPLGTDSSTSYDNPLPVAGVANQNGLRFIFSSGGENPLSEKDSGRYYVDTYALVNEVPYQIDYNYFDDVFTPTRGTIAMLIDHITSYQTYDAPMSYTFKITPTKIYPEHTAITIEIPPVITVLTATVPRCTYIVKGEPMVSVVMKTLELSLRPLIQSYEQGQTLGQILVPRTIINITDMFTNRWYLDPGTPLYVICEGFRNPRTTRETATFKIHVQDSLGFYIEHRMTGITTQMLTRPIVPYFDVQMSNFTNGDINTYSMKTTSPLPHFNGDLFQFQFPTQNILKDVTACTPLGVLTDIKCRRISTNLVQAEMFFQGDYIEPYIEIRFLFLEVQNPPDTRLSSPFTKVQMLDPLQYLLTQYLGTTTLQTKFYAVIQEKTLTQSNYSLLVQSDYIITYKTINRMPPGSAFYITYPDTVQPPVTLATCRVQYGSLTFDLFGCNVNLEFFFIVITGGFNVDVAANQEVKITFGPIMTPISQLDPGNFSMQVYTDSRLIYKIDEINSQVGIIPDFDCDHPCRRCSNSYTPNSSRIDCINCKTNVRLERLIYLEQQRCIASCPDGKFGDIKNDKICTFCPNECLTCFDELTCLRCKQNSLLPELYNNWCKTACPEGLCSINFKCLTCNSPQFSFISINPTPSVVGKISKLTFSASLDSNTNTYFANNDLVWFLIPSPGMFYISNDTSQEWRIKLYKDYFSDTALCESLTLGIVIDYCTIYLSRVSLKINTTVSNLRSATFRISGFQNPSTTTPIPKIKSFLTTQNEVQKAYILTTILENLSPERLNVAKLTPGSIVIGASQLLITVEFTTQNVLDPDQQIWVTFPYWNPRSNNPQHMIRSSTPNCVGISSIKASPSCQYDQARRILIVRNFVDTQLPIGSPIKFTVDTFVNPFNSIEKRGFKVTTMENTGTGKIDESDILSISVTQFAELEQPSVTRGDSMTTVGQFSSLKFSFRVNLPVDPDCRIKIIFPSDQPLTEDLTSSTGTNLFQSAYGISAFNKEENYVEVSGCPTYSESSQAYQSNSVTLSKIINIGWVKDTLPFKFQLFAISQGLEFNIAEVQTPFMIVQASTMLSRGKILQLKIESPPDLQVSNKVTFRLTLKPIHRIPSSNKIKIKFPSTGLNKINLDSPCNVLTDPQPASGLIVPDNALCEIDDAANQITISNSFGINQFLNGSDAFSFVVRSSGSNPVSACGYVQYEASTYYVVNDIEYPIDYQQFDSLIDSPPFFDPYLPKPSILTATLLNYSDVFISSYKPVTYFFQVTISKPIEENGYLEILMPRTIRLPFDVNQINCTSFKDQIIVYEYSTPVTNDPLKFRLKEFINKLGGYGSALIGSPIIIQCDGLWNPRTIESTDSITISINDNNDCPVELLDANMQVSMRSITEFKSIKIYNDQKENGRLGAYTFEIVPSILFYEDDYFEVTFPQELVLPSNPVCDPGNLFSKVTCTSPSSNRLRAQFKFKSPVLSEEYMVSFRVFNVKNSANTTLSSAFTDFKAFDLKGSQIQYYTKQGPRIQNNQYSISTGNLSQTDNQIGSITDYTIKYVTMNKMQQGSSFIIIYPETVNIPQELLKPSGELLTCTITLNEDTYPMKCPVDIDTRTIKLHTGLQNVLVPEGQILKIKIGLIQNPITPLSVSTFQLTSFTDFYQNFIIDKVLDNMVPQYQCNYPCATCPSQDQRSICLSCFTTEVPKYLYSNYCYELCPFPLIPNDKYVCEGPTIEFEAQLLNISNYQAGYEPSIYTLEISPLKVIPDGTILQIKLPEEINLATGSANIKCDTYLHWYGGQTFINSGKVELINSSPPLLVQFEGLFLSKAKFDLSTKITIVCDQLRNPQTLSASGSFSIIMSHPSAPTSTVSTGMQIRMKTLPNFVKFLMEPLGLTTGVTTEFRFTLKAPQNLRSGCYLQMVMPTELKLPDAIICSLSSSNLQSIGCTQSVTCVNKPFASSTEMIQVPTGLVIAEFVFLKDTGVQANESIAFVISNIGNPSSTKPVEVKNVTLFDENGVKIVEMTEGIPNFSINSASTVDVKTIKLDSYQRGQLTGFTIKYQAKNKVAPQQIIVITYPLTANFQGSVDIACSLTVNGIGLAHKCSLNRAKREIVFTLSSQPSVKTTDNLSISQDAMVEVTVKDFRNEAKRLGVSRDKLTLRVYTDTQRVYGIDQILDGLILFTCDDGFFYDETSKQCIQCDINCKTCTESNDKCTSCNDNKVLDEFKCYDLCT